MTKSLALLHFCVFSSPIYLDVPQKEVSGATLMLGGDYIVMRQHSSLNIVIPIRQMLQSDWSMTIQHKVMSDSDVTYSFVM